MKIHTSQHPEARPPNRGTGAQKRRTLLDKRSGRPPVKAGLILQADPNSAHIPIPCVVALPGSQPEESVPLNPVFPPFVFWEEFARSLREIDEVRLSVEGRMEDLKKAFNESVGRCRLKIRPWGRTKSAPPYAVYWVFLTKKRKIFENRTWQAIEDMRPRWYKRLKLRTRRELDLIIHRSGLDANRRTVHRFDDDMEALNEAHRVLARNLDSIRKLLRGRVAGGHLVAPPLPAEAEKLWLPDAVRGQAEGAWRLECLIRRTTGDLKLLSRLQARQPGRVRHRLEFRQGPGHPHGHLVWRDLVTRSTYASLDDRTKRKLKIPKHVSVLITPFELARRQLMRGVKDRASLVRKLWAKAREALELARTNLAALKTEPSLGIGLGPDWDERRFA